MASSFSGRNGRNAAMWGAGVQAKAMDASLGDLSTGYRDASQNFGEQKNLWAQLAGETPKYSQMYGNATGVNGQPGYDQAKTAFQTNPGYQFQMDQGLDAIDRRAASRGMLASGNNQTDTLKYAGGLANQEWSNWLNNLLRGQQTGMVGTAGQASSLGNQANLDYRYGSDRGNIITNANNKIADIGMSGFKAGDQAAANRQSAIMGGLNLGAQLLGGASGSGGGLGSLFGGGGSVSNALGSVTGFNPFGTGSW